MDAEGEKQSTSSHGDLNSDTIDFVGGSSSLNQQYQQKECLNDIEVPASNVAANADEAKEEEGKLDEEVTAFLRDFSARHDADLISSDEILLEGEYSSQSQQLAKEPAPLGMDQLHDEVKQPLNSRSWNRFQRHWLHLLMTNWLIWMKGQEVV